MKKDLLLIFSFVIILVILIGGVKIESVQEHYLNNIDNITNETEVITLEIDCHLIYDNWDILTPSLKEENYLPENGYVLKSTELVLREADTVYDILLRASKHFRIQLETKGYGDSKYIRGISYLYEFDCGALSGWVYLVNGIKGDQSISDYKLKNNDYINIVYTCDLGDDVLEENYENIR
ncbi:MAG TPA: DUF4430 domain-containing protein [Acholeplasmataceae bacterium]|nr:DUF4430 domain-containing protein [Acholeplasmataceae bacterium]